ncbi:hypothetical protein [Mycobacterium sp. EPa45]|uniref:hypothetical protein n=1 Tax=Mycobacterium sp. EPa45 TaxID=1545728 RepID=UPI001F221A78|nr:hypothetical protein [Mycobacterium sp. EPa45]
MTTAGALALSPVIATPHEMAVAPSRISAEAVQLTDAWSDLANNTVANVIQLAATAFGVNNNVPLPSPTIPLAPVVTQLVLNQLIYAAQLFTGQGASIPAEISAHLTGVISVGSTVVNALPPIIAAQLQLPIAAVQSAINTFTGSANPLVGVFEAPAAFLDVILNNEVGLLGIYGPIGLPIVVRNLLTQALYTTPPTIVLPFKKAGAATSQPTAAATTASPRASGVAGSARDRSKAPSAASASAKKATSAKTGTKSGGARSKRG